MSHDWYEWNQWVDRNGITCTLTQEFMDSDYDFYLSEKFVDGVYDYRGISDYVPIKNPLSFLIELNDLSTTIDTSTDTIVENPNESLKTPSRKEKSQIVSSVVEEIQNAIKTDKKTKR